MAKKLKYGKIWTKGNKQFRYAYCKIGKNTYKAKMVRDFARGAKRAYDFQFDIGLEDNQYERQYEIFTLSNAWWVKKSIEFAKAVYHNGSKDAKKMLGSRKAKWNDFIITGMEIGDGANFSDLYQYTVATSGDDMTAAEVSSDETLYEDQTKGSELEGDSDLGAEIEYGFTIAATDQTGGVRSYNIFDQYMRSLYHNKIKNNHLCATCTRRLKAGGFKIKNAKKASRRRLENPIPPAPSRGIDS